VFPTGALMNDSASMTRAPRRGRLAAAVIPVIVGAALLGSLDACSKPAAVAEVVPVLVRQVSGVNRSDLVVVSGDVEASRSGNLGFQVPGRVVKVWPEEGEFVQAGQPLAQLDTIEYHLQLVMASAAARQAEDQYKRLQQMNDQQGIPPADFVKIETGLQQARAQMALVRNHLANTLLVAPLGGAVARRGIEVGEMAAPGMPVFTIIATDPVQVRVGVPEAEVGRIKVGQNAEIRVPAMPNQKFYGKVKLIGVAADPMSRTYTVKITVPNARRMLRPGMIAEARIQQDSQVNAITIPASAIVRDADGATQVFAYNPADKRVYARRITVGTVYGKEVEVITGLTTKEMIVVGGQHRIREGSRVEATTAKATEVAVDSRTAP
jgi:membrane fusion protein (multidrug efflux system)